MNPTIPIIEDDFLKVFWNNLLKMSYLTLKYCFDQGIIDRRQYTLYKRACECPDGRNSLAERLIVPQVNNIFIYYYESL